MVVILEKNWIFMFRCEVNKGNECDGVSDHVKEFDKHSRINSTKAPASGIYNDSDPRMVSQSGTVCEGVCL